MAHHWYYRRNGIHGPVTAREVVRMTKRWFASRFRVQTVEGLYSREEWLTTEEAMPRLLKERAEELAEERTSRERQEQREREERERREQRQRERDAERRREAQREQERRRQAEAEGKCPDCNGSGTGDHVSCTGCPDDRGPPDPPGYYLPCGACGGTGLAKAERPCALCHGSGGEEVEVPLCEPGDFVPVGSSREWKPCPKCQGRGST
jgi:hypothetical protein